MEATKRKKPTQRSRAWNTKSHTFKGQQRNTPVHKHGHFRPATDPPSHVVAPWNHLILMKVYVYGSSNFTTGLIISKDLGTWIGEQLGADTMKTDNLLVRVNSISAWNLSGTYIGMSVFDYTSSSNDDEALGTYIDAGTRTHSPSVGYRWPSTTKMHAVSTSTNSSGHEALNQRRIATIHCESSEKILVHLDINWKPNGEKMSLQYQLSTLETINSTLRKIDDKLPNADETRPVTVENTLPIPVYLPIPVRKEERNTTRPLTQDEYQTLIGLTRRLGLQEQDQSTVGSFTQLEAET